MVVGAGWEDFWWDDGGEVGDVYGGLAVGFKGQEGWVKGVTRCGWWIGSPSAVVRDFGLGAKGEERERGEVDSMVGIGRDR